MSTQTSQAVSDLLRKLTGTRAKTEQELFEWKPGSLIEADEGSMRVKRVPCKRDCKIPSCGSHENGHYRLLHYRFICIMPRGRRDLAKFYELPHETCEGGGSGVPFSAKEWDDIGPRVLSGGNLILLADGAGAYQSVAPKDRIAYHTSEREPASWSKERYEKYYKHLEVSHGIVSHSAEQWSEKDKVKVITPNGATKTIRLKKGTQCVDGLWPEMRGSIPHAVHTGDWERCRSYIWSWVWSTRHSGKDLLRELGHLLGDLRLYASDVTANDVI